MFALRKRSLLGRDFLRDLSAFPFLEKNIDQRAAVCYVLHSSCPVTRFYLPYLPALSSNLSGGDFLSRIFPPSFIFGRIKTPRDLSKKARLETEREETAQEHAGFYRASQRDPALFVQGDY